MAKSAHPDRPFPLPRKVLLHGKFNPDGDHRQDPKSLIELWVEARGCIDKKIKKGIIEKEKQLQQLNQAIGKLGPIIAEVLRGDRETSDANAEVRRLLPDQETRNKVFEFMSQSIHKKPEDLARERMEEEEATRQQTISQKNLQNQQSMIRAVSRLFESVNSGDSCAAEALYQVTFFATSLLTNAVHHHPELFRNLVEKNTLWPVMAHANENWQNTMNHLRSLGLGKITSIIKTKLREVRGSDVDLPARRWAKESIRVIDETRWKTNCFASLMHQLGGLDEWADFAIKHGWDIEALPSWVSEISTLKPFSVATFDEWKVVVRKIIREEVPNFHQLPEWATQRMTAASNGRNTPGEIQNAILDDIVSALKRLVPKESC